MSNHKTAHLNCKTHWTGYLCTVTIRCLSLFEGAPLLNAPPLMSSISSYCLQRVYPTLNLLSKENVNAV